MDHGDQPPKRGRIGWGDLIASQQCIPLYQLNVVRFSETHALTQLYLILPRKTELKHKQGRSSPCIILLAYFPLEGLINAVLSVIQVLFCSSGIQLRSNSLTKLVQKEKFQVLDLLSLKTVQHQHFIFLKSQHEISMSWRFGFATNSPSLGKKCSNLRNTTTVE